MFGCTKNIAFLYCKWAGLGNEVNLGVQVMYGEPVCLSHILARYTGQPQLVWMAFCHLTYYVSNIAL